ncbi:uncharacterized protein LOC110266778 [Arachis ipaensis]|uniref:uncharacterized protein LOC110266778 n=1 Tax=Arachis ipaensis TaxID=130454 RepID=UPI000A2B0CA2|nr:uncharacterized protein LOC110266778 [Arachis ipaensis]XP_025628694.1 uncharacterized protein LOC112721888 [Arachis hypogaea]
MAHEFRAFTSVHLTLMEDLLEGNQTDSAMLRLLAKLKTGELGPDYAMKEGLLMYQGQVWVPDFKGLRELLLQEFHSSLRGGHVGILKTYKALGESFFLAWNASPSSQSAEFTGILVVVDRFIKVGHFSALKPGFTAKDVAQSDGQTEVVNRTLEQYLRVFTHTYPKQWTSYLSWAEFCYNGSYHCTINMTLHEALFGFPMNVLPGYSSGTTSVIEVDEMLKVREVLNKELTYFIQRAQNKMKKQADSHRRDMEFNPGDCVLLKIKSYRQRSLSLEPHNKLRKRYYGPYKVIQKVGKVAYRLELPESCALHPVFHVSVLKPFHGPPPVSVPSAAEFSSSLQPCPAAIIVSRVVSTPTGSRIELLIDWEGVPRHETTWVDMVELSREFPDVDLENKVIVEMGIIDATPNPNQQGPAEEEPIEDEKEESHGPEMLGPRRKKCPTWHQDYVM